MKRPKLFTFQKVSDYLVAGSGYGTQTLVKSVVQPAKVVSHSQLKCLNIIAFDSNFQV